MKSIHIKAGLGNQMFQYVYGKSLELAGKKVVFDLSFFYGNKAKGDTSREFTLDKFNIKTNALFVQHRRYPLYALYKKFLRLLGHKVEEYFQEDTYVKHIEQHIRNEFTLRDPLSKKAQDIRKKIQSTTSVSIHVRRGDYVSNKETHAYHGLCSLTYYQEAMRHIAQEVVSPSYFIFSDDSAWAKEYLNVSGAIFVSDFEFPDYEDLMLMSECKYNIIANSSFSWWGAWLNTYEKKIVIAPKKWFQASKTSEYSIVPSSWIRI